MNDLQKGTIALIKSALTGEKNSLPENFVFADAVALAKKHEIYTMLYYGALNCDVSGNDILMQDLFLITCQTLALAERQKYFLNLIFNAFNEAHIKYMPLKGTLLKEMYPRSEMRIMGDADILIDVKQYDNITSIMQKLGFKKGVESDHEFVWYNNGICIELHRRLIPSYNKDYYKYYGEGWKLAKNCDGTRYSMTDEDQMIYLFTHFAKHYRSAGIGIRHIIDLWVFRNNKTLDEIYIKNELEKLKLYEFYLNILNTLNLWFNGEEENEITNFITNTIFNNGVYGRDETLTLSSAFITSKKVNGKVVRIVEFLKTVFLPLKNMQTKYPILKKAPVLLPVMWFVRGFKAVLFKRKKIAEYSSSLKVITKESVEEFGDALKFVGLDFNFKE